MMKKTDERLKKAMFKLGRKAINNALNKCDLHNVIVPKGTFCLSCEKEPATHGIGETKTVCGKCWNKIVA